MKTNNLFKIGLASLALASVITSNMFAAVNVAMIDVKKEFGTDGLSKFTVLTNAEVKDTNAAFNGLTIVGGKKIIASAQVAETNNTAYNDFTRSIIQDGLRQDFESILLAFTPHKLGDISGSLNGMSLALAGAKSIGGDMKPGHNMLNIPLVSINAKSLGAQTGTSIWPTNMNNDNMIAFKRKDLTKSSAIHNLVIKHLSLANVGSAETFLLKNTFNIMNEYALSSIIPLSKHTGDNLAFSVLNEDSMFTPSLGKKNMNMKKTGFLSNYVLEDTAGISCADLFKPNSGSCSNDIGKNLFTATVIPMENPGANLANTLDLGAAV